MAASRRIWDMHHHWVCEARYIERLLREMDLLGIERTVLIAMGDFAPELFVNGASEAAPPDNAALSLVIRDYPDRLMGWGFVRLGLHDDSTVQRVVDLGLHGLKFLAPSAPYSDPRFYDVYRQAVEHRLPCLFHTGIFSPALPGHGIRSEYCRPIHLEPLAHEFPELQMVCAHLGVCWNDEAAALCRLFPNVYADLSGRVDGWRMSRSTEWFRQTFYWTEAHRKLLFGSDVHVGELGETLRDQERLLQDMGWNEGQLDRVFGENARRLMGLDSGVVSTDM